MTLRIRLRGCRPLPPSRRCWPACASMPPPAMQRDAPTSPGQPQADAAGTAAEATGTPTACRPGRCRRRRAGPQPQIRRGTGQVINRSAAARAAAGLGGSSGAATFNFEGESLHAVVKAILGDMLGQNYVIAPGVQGTVTLATPQAGQPGRRRCSLLEMVLGWNNARMVYSDGRYNIVPADQALAGTVAPRTGSPATRARLRSARGAAALHLRDRDGEAAQALRAPERDRQRRQRAQRHHASPAPAPNSRTTCARSRSSTSTGCRACRWACSRCSRARPARSSPTWRRCSASRASRRSPACSASCRWKAPTRCW